MAGTSPAKTTDNTSTRAQVQGRLSPGGCWKRSWSVRFRGPS